MSASCTGMAVAVLLVSQIDLKIIFALLLAVLAAAIIFAFWKKALPIFLILTFFSGFCYASVFGNFTRTDFADGCYIFAVGKIKQKDTAAKVELKSNYGALVAQTENFNEIRSGDQLKICLESKQIIKAEPQMAGYYLANYKTVQVIKNPQFEIVGHRPSIENFFNNIRLRVDRVFAVIWPGDKGQLAKGLILGDPNFSDAFAEKIKKTGLTHITAVSGFNISIILVVMFGALRAAAGKKFAFYASVFILVAFFFLTGGASSVTRAAIMGLVVIIGKMIGRRALLINDLVLAAMIMLLVNPFVVYDIGFQLSFAATVGLVLSESLSVLAKTKNKYLKELLAMLAQTLSAQVLCFGIILYHFGSLTLIGFISNIFVLPVLPLGMLLAALALAFGLVSIKLALVLNVFLGLVVGYVKLVIDLFALLPFGQFNAGALTWPWAIVYYILLIATAYFIKFFYEKKWAENI